MPYVEQKDGAIVAAYGRPQPGRAETWLADDHPDVAAFQKPAPTTADIKAEAARRLRLTDWYVIRAADPSDGTPVPADIQTQRDAIRTASDALEAMDPIPSDYADDRHWGE